MSKVLIVGHGYVGSAVSSIFKKKEKTIIDPKLNKNKIRDFKGNKFDIIFVCVDTPKNQKFKTFK
jgi:UDP-glucose 6-dehydrogenase